jgi:CheY-like chemotaxis protein
MSRLEPSKSNVRALLIEAEVERALEHKVILEGIGLHVIWSADGAEGLQLALALAPDLAVINQRLPGIDGHQICQRLQENPKTSAVPIILLTASEVSSKLPDDLLSNVIRTVSLDDYSSVMLLETVQQMGFIG